MLCACPPHLPVQASDKYARALVLQPRDWRALSRWGTALCEQARTLSAEEREKRKLLKQGCKRLERAARLMPAHFKTRSRRLAIARRPTASSDPHSNSP